MSIAPPVPLPPCAACGSADVRRVPLVHAEGTTAATARATTQASGVSLGGGFGVGQATTTTHGTAQTALAARLAPPRPPAGDGSGVYLAALGLGVVGVLAFLFGGAAWAFGAMLGVGTAGLLAGLLGAFDTRASRAQAAARHSAHGQALARWHRAVLCLRCGAVTDPGEAADDPRPVVAFG